MTSFFSFRIAPGVRLSASPRGLRAHVGPRAARLHVGGGRTGVSTGAGPFTYYQSLSGDGGSPGRSRRRSAAALAKEQRASAIQEQLDRLCSLHRQSFPPAAPPVAPLPPVPSVHTLEEQARAERLQGISWFRFARRREARARAADDARTRRAQLLDDAHQAQQRAQEELDRQWVLLCANDTEQVLATLATHFGDNDAPAVAVGVDGDEARLAVMVPGADIVPEREPSTTSSGNLSLARMTKTRRTWFYRQAVAGDVLSTVNEALAVAPALASASVVALRATDPDVFGGQRTQALLAVRLRRDRLAPVHWRTAEAWDVIEQVGEDLRVDVFGRTKRLEPLPLEDEPDLAALVEDIDWED